MAQLEANYFGRFRITREPGWPAKEFANPYDWLKAGT
jgi:hypothetical protein